MKLLVHGMQSSGATSFTLFLAQRPGTLALVDIANTDLAPCVDPGPDMVAKVVVTVAHPWPTHVERFRPDRTILFLRDPRDNWQSLSTKPYRDGSGSMEEKFRLLDGLFARRSDFDLVVHYEDFVRRDPAVLEGVTQLGWPVGPAQFDYARRHEAIFADLWHHLPHLFEELNLVFGNVRGRSVTEAHRDKPRDPAAEAELERLCPLVLAHYRAREAAGPP
ncbi:hypothetical protein HHL28_12960 [Aerophototrophica crusticola]|uniref:Sulfotransferase domain-containing protein n=1 Tax=Aerophototrophica crusticola TaxID=1709002 RepID=A0A858R901_9PROT|nr:hypothetical protein HHL28_12960 [Rhodospirillaceae bacterium B3]